jgi:hypothetical protein
MRTTHDIIREHLMDPDRFKPKAITPEQAFGEYFDKLAAKHKAQPAVEKKPAPQGNPQAVVHFLSLFKKL